MWGMLGEYPVCENLEGCLCTLLTEEVTHLNMFLARDQCSYSQDGGEQGWAQELDCCKIEYPFSSPSRAQEKNLCVQRVGKGRWVLNPVPKPSAKQGRKQDRYPQGEQSLTIPVFELH